MSGQKVPLRWEGKTVNGQSSRDGFDRVPGRMNKKKAGQGGEPRLGITFFGGEGVTKSKVHHNKEVFLEQCPR